MAAQRNNMTTEKPADSKSDSNDLLGVNEPKPRAWIVIEPDGNERDGSYGGCVEAACIGSERPNFGSEPLYDLSTVRLMLESAWRAGYYHAGYTNDIAYAEEQAGKAAQFFLTPNV